MTQKRPPDEKEEDQTGTTSGDTGTGGAAGGAIEFRDFLISPKDRLDEELPLDVKKQILEKHRQINEINIQKQKAKRDDYKNKKSQIQSYAFENQRGVDADIKTHLLANTVQFGSGVIETQVNAIPSEANEANQEKAYQLRYEYAQRYTPDSTPRFTPKPYPTR